MDSLFCRTTRLEGLDAGVSLTAPKSMMLKKAFDRALTKIAGTTKEFPKISSASLENRVLMAVPPVLYSENYPEEV